MAADNRRAEGRRPPYRGRSDPEGNPVLGEIRDEESILLGKELSNREGRNWQRRRGRSHAQPQDMHN
jgi:hypothetical protein